MIDEAEISEALTSRYIPLDLRRFLAKLRGHDAEVKAASFHAVEHYWNTDHCEGIKNDDAVLRAVCDHPADEVWARVKPVVFGEVFKQGAHDLWHHVEVEASWQKAALSVERRKKAGSKGGLAKAKRHPRPDSAA